MCILVVDDEPEIRHLISQLLIDEGYTVAQATNGREALDYLQAADSLPCLILLDMMMPILNGWDFPHARQCDSVVQAIPVVLVSAYPALAVAAAPLGVQGALDKPIKLDRLLAGVQRYCSGTPPVWREASGLADARPAEAAQYLSLDTTTLAQQFRRRPDRAAVYAGQAQPDRTHLSPVLD
jgi:CheY-like chemotaxis protein